MPASASLYPTTATPTQTGGSWATATNATGSGTGTTSASWAVWQSSTVSGTTGTMQLSGYGAQAATNGGVQPTSIDSVAVTIVSNVGNPIRFSSLTIQLYSGAATAIGSPTTFTASATLTNSETVTLSGANAPTWSQMADLRTQIVAVHTTTTSSTFNLDAVGVVINYSTAASSTQLKPQIIQQAVMHASFY